MAKFLVQNLSDRVIRLGIEPWADLEVLAPNAQVTFEYTEPAEIEFTVLSNDRVGVSIVSDEIKVMADGREKIFRPPPADW
jgi:hypothetical protein